MLIKLILALGLLYFLFKWIKQFKNIPPAKQKQKLIQLGLIAVAGIILFGVVTGKMHWLGAIFAGLLPFLRRGFLTLANVVPFWLRNTGGRANFNTEHMQVEVNLQARTISGVIIKGPFSGQRIEQLSPDDLVKLADYYSDKDKKSYYFIRVAQKGFTGQQQPPPQNDFSDPDKQEALDILGLQDQPTRDDVIKAHRRLINKLHPDRGGSDFLASRVNLARDVLLKYLDREGS